MQLAVDGEQGRPWSHQPQCTKHIIIISHQVKLPDRSKRLFGCQSRWLLLQLQTLASNTHGAAGDQHNREAYWQTARPSGCASVAEAYPLDQPQEQAGNGLWDLLCYSFKEVLRI